IGEGCRIDIVGVESVEDAVGPADRNIDRPYKLARLRPSASFWVLVELALDRVFSARQHHYAPSVRGLERRVAAHTLLPHAAGRHVERLAKLAPFDLAYFVERETCIISAGERRLKTVRGPPPGAHIATVGARAPYTCGHPQAGRFALARPAEEVEA